MPPADIGEHIAPSDQMFRVAKCAPHSIGPRLGHLRLPGRHAIETPHYLGNTSRGTIPHITQDNFRCHTRTSSVYVGLEDFLERASPRKTLPLHQFHTPDGASPLRRFIALPDDTWLVLGARRTPPVPTPIANANTASAIAVCTSLGFQTLQATDYSAAAERLRPDVIVALGDIPYARALGSKRIEKATDRCIEWVQGHVALRKESGSARAEQGKLFASLLPVSCAKQQFYIDALVEELSGDVSGLAVFAVETLEDLPEALWKLPRLAFTAPDSPHELLRQVALGVDVFTIPFIAAATDAGVALDFAFPASAAQGDMVADRHEAKLLGIDMWSASHAVDLSPLVHGCDCYACTNHHRAYVQHLLGAKEMLGWTLLQMHNHRTLDHFFAGVRHSIVRGSFEEDAIAFERIYERGFPEGTGQGPRVRGYQFKAEGPGERKKNAAPFTMLSNGQSSPADATLLSANVDADRLEQQGFAE